MTHDDPDIASQPLEHACALPAHFYVGAESLDRDQHKVFAHGWQYLARADQLAGSGDHVVGDIAGVPLLLVRGDDGALRALHNVCRHRAGPLALCNGHAAKRLRCH
jgi:choline monooxygenase